MKKTVLITILTILFPFYALANEPGCGDLDQPVLEAIEIPGTVPEGCIEEYRDIDGNPVETCDAQTDEKTAFVPNAQSNTPWIGASSTSFSISTPKGAKLTGKIVWHSSTSFELKDMKLTDTKCDSKSVYFYANYTTAWDYPKHYNKNGCNTTSTWKSLKGSFGQGLYSIGVNVCRSGSSDCGSTYSVNPYY